MNQAPEPPRTLVPPRPNLGPEPWDEGAGLARPGLVLAIVGALAGALAVGLWRRRRRRGGRTSGPRLSQPPLDDSPEARLLALCEQARGALSSRFGPGLRARTTEEIAVDPRIRELLGAEHFDRLTELLRAGDRLKFAGKGDAGLVEDQIGALAVWASSLDALPHPSRDVTPRNRRSPGERNGRRSPRTAPRRS